MTQEVRLWEISLGDQLEEISQSKLNFEERIENWLENDISIISQELLVIGRQVETGFGGVIDILCLDNNGDVVIIELKRDKTPRDIIAQVLDYGSWVQGLSYEKISEIGNAYYREKSTLEEAFRNKFREDYPEIINESHKMLVVASKIDGSSERIIKYLSDSYGVGINAITFNYFQKENGQEYLSRVFLIDPLEAKPEGKKRPKSLSFEEFQEMANNNGVGEIYRSALEKLRPFFYTITRHKTGIAIKGRDKIQNSIQSIIVIYPYYSDADNGLKLNIYIDRLLSYYNIDKEQLVCNLPINLKIVSQEHGEETGEFYIKCEEEIDNLLSVLKKEELFLGQ